MSRLVAALTLAVVCLGGLAASRALADHHGGGHSEQRQWPGDLIEVGTSAGTFGTLGAALEAAGLVEALRGEGPFTVLAPTDEAFAALPAGAVATLLKPENKELLTAVLNYHVVPGRVLAAQAAGAGEVQTLNGAPLRFGIDAGRLKVNETGVIATDVLARNGVIHAIDAVLPPPGFALPEEAASDSQSAAAEVIDLAIRRGVPLYNAGDHAACAGVYEVALAALTTHPGLMESVVKTATQALGHGRGMRDMDARAWAFRRGLDAARTEMMAGR